jgi:pimeloyl-ACP methyl ester carboxylesterase
MVQAKDIAAALIAACLSECSYAMLDNYTSPDKPVPPPTPTDTPSAMSDKASAMGRTAAEDQRTAPTAAVKPVVVPSTGNNGTPAEPSVVANHHVTVTRGRAYLFRGIAGLIFSRGMDELAQRINRIRVAASVDTYLVWRGVANQAILDYRRNPKPITLIGHSMGGDSAVAFAEYLNAADIPVSLLVTYDPSRFAGDVPGNVERYINIYQSRSVMGGGNVVGGRGFHGHYGSAAVRKTIRYWSTSFPAPSTSWLFLRSASSPCNFCPYSTASFFNREASSTIFFATVLGSKLLSLAVRGTADAAPDVSSRVPVAVSCD